MKASITNHDDTQTLSAGYYIREIAVFAQEDDKSDTEVLYSIAVADVADFLPTYNGNNPILIIQKYYVTVDESKSAIIVPSNYGEDLEATKKEVENDLKEYVTGYVSEATAEDIDNILGGYFIDDGSGGGESEEITEEIYVTV